MSSRKMAVNVELELTLKEELQPNLRNFFFNLPGGIKERESAYESVQPAMAEEPNSGKCK